MNITLIDDEGANTPDYPAPLEVGVEVLVPGMICINNDVGGTEFLDHAGLTCRVERRFWDYEAGWRFVGELVDPEAIEMSRLKGATGIDPADYRIKYPSNPDLAAAAETARAAYDPARVYFDEHSLSAAPAPRL